MAPFLSPAAEMLAILLDNINCKQNKKESQYSFERKVSDDEVLFALDFIFMSDFFRLW